MKLTITFDLPEEKEEYDACIKGMDMSIALFDIANDIFRPARKHGYSDQRLQNLSERETEIIGILEEQFYEILRDHKIDIG